MLVIGASLNGEGRLAKQGPKAQNSRMPTIATKQGRIGYSELGSGPLRPIVFLHGVGSDKSVWAPQLDHFGRSRRAIAFDYPGYGDSDPARPGTTRDDYAAAICQGMDALGVPHAHVCGLSLGGVIAIALHHAEPGRCASLILADSFAVHPDGQGIRDRSLDASRSIGMRAMAEQRTPFILGSNAPDHVMVDTVETMARIDLAAFAIGLDAVWLADQRDRLETIAVPTLVIVGDEDKPTPPALSEALAHGIAGAKLEVIEGAGHITNAEKPAEFNRLVDAFLVGIEHR
jgi:3-oxoadipate enol-lactonase